MPAHGLPPERKLRRRGEFQRVFDTGRRAHGRYLTIIAAPAAGPRTRLGIVASRKLGGAVVRNRAKRLIREVFRTTDPLAIPLDLVVIPRPVLPEAPLDALRRDFSIVLRRCVSNR